MFKLLGTLTGALAVVGMPLFAVLGGISLIAWLASEDPKHRFLRRVAANVLDEKFASSIILVTIPLFVFVGYLMAESKAPQRIVKASSAALGWMPGGLAIVCVLASAVFTMLTGGSGVTIVAIGGLLLPVLVEQGYPKKFALGLVTTAGCGRSVAAAEPARAHLLLRHARPRRQSLLRHALAPAWCSCSCSACTRSTWAFARTSRPRSSISASSWPRRGSSNGKRSRRCWCCSAWAAA